MNRANASCDCHIFIDKLLQMYDNGYIDVVTFDNLLKAIHRALREIEKK